MVFTLSRNFLSFSLSRFYPPPSLLNPLKSYLPSPSLPKLKKPQMASFQPKSIIFPGLPWWLSGKESTCQFRRCGFDPWVGKIPWRRKWQPTPVFLPGKSHGQRSLVGYSPWGREESDTTERLHFHFSLSCTGEGNGNPLQYSCLENPRDGSLVGPRLWGCTELDTTDVT